VSDDIFQDYADAHGISRVEAKERMFRVLYSGRPGFAGSYDGYSWISTMTGRMRTKYPPMHFWSREDPLGGVEPDDEGVYKITTMK
jgi:hypothetical protein